MKTVRAFALVATLLVSLCATVTRLAAAPLTLTGVITSGQTSFAISDLQALAPILETVNGVDYVGASLWTLLGSGSRIVQTSAPGTNTNNPILSRYVMAMGADGRMSLISVGEINPSFGGTGLPYLLAYRENGIDLLTPKLIVPDDPTGTRNVMSLVNLDVRNVQRPPQVAAKGTPSTKLEVTGTNTTATYDRADLQGLPATTLTGVTFLQGSTPQGPFNFKGVNLWDLLTSVGVGNTEDILTSYFVATGSDGFEVVFSLAELNPAFHPLGDTPDLIAYAATGPTTNPLIVPTLYPAGAPTDGVARIVKPGDSKGGRYVSNLTRLEIVDAVPLPATLTLLLVGLVGMLPMACRHGISGQVTPGAI